MGRKEALTKIAIALLLTAFVIGTYISMHMARSEDVEALLVLTTEPREATLMAIGLVLVLTGIIMGTRGKDDWQHAHDPNRVTRRPYLPSSPRDARYILHETLEAKLRVMHGLSQEELNGMSRQEMAFMIEDDELTRFVLDDEVELSRDDIRRLKGRIEELG